MGVDIVSFEQRRESLARSRSVCEILAVTLCSPKDRAMNTPKKPTPIVEDETMVGGTDAETGAPVIKPKTSDGRADESVRPTDPREAPKK
jgi:hypothetical protein